MHVMVSNFLFSKLNIFVEEKLRLKIKFKTTYKKVYFQYNIRSNFAFFIKIHATYIYNAYIYQYAIPIVILN